MWAIKTVLDRAPIERRPRRRYLGVLATGANVVNTTVAQERRIVVTRGRAFRLGSPRNVVAAGCTPDAYPLRVQPGR